MFDFAEELLHNAERYDPVVRGDSVWLKCPFHSGGQERTASCRVNLIKGKYPAGFFYCYGCGAHGDWNKLAEEIGLQKIEGQSKREQEASTIRKISSKEKEELFEDIPCDFDFAMSVPWDPDRQWRNISGKILNAVGGRLFYNAKVKDQNLFLPCYQNGELKGGIQALMNKPKGQSCYRNTSGSWVKKSWFLYDYQKERIKKKDNILAIVEGPRDALNFTQYGFPAVAILGSKNWSSIKSSLIQMLDPKLIVLALDPDEAGQSAFQKIEMDLKNCSNLLKVDFHGDEDPGNLPPEKIKKLYQKVVKYSENL